MTKFIGKMRELSINLIFKYFRDAIVDHAQKLIFLRPLRAVQSRIPAALSTSKSNNT
jgi:hypothetical protein